MAWAEGLTNSSRFLRDIANIFCTANKDESGLVDEARNWSLVYPTPYNTANMFDEVLVADDTNLIFSTSEQDLIDNNSFVLKYLDGTEVDSVEYTVNFLLGEISFVVPKLDSLMASYDYKTSNKLQTGLGKITDRIVLKTVTTKIIPEPMEDPYGTNTSSQVDQITMYWEIVKPKFVTNLETGVETTYENHYYVQTRIFDVWDSITEQYKENDFDDVSGNIINFNSHVSEWSQFSWYRDFEEQLNDALDEDGGTTNIEDGLTYAKIPYVGIFENLTIQFYISVDNDHAAMVLIGDPTLNYDNYLISFGYVGKISNFKDSSNDTAGNFALTTGSSSVPCIPNGVTRDPLYGNIIDIKYSDFWGEYTATGVSDISMYKTRNDTFYQRHYVSFITTSEDMDKDRFNPSRWTNKFHLSPAYVVHGYDGYRGWLTDVVVVDNTSIIHLDKLVINKGSVDPEKPEETYRYFKINAPFSFLTNTPNFHCGIGIKEA